MGKSRAHTEPMAIPIVALLPSWVGSCSSRASIAGPWAWILVVLGGLGLLVLLAVALLTTRSAPLLLPPASAPAPEVLAATDCRRQVSGCSSSRTRAASILASRPSSPPTPTVAPSRRW